jgi:hypothetical protein
MEKEEAANIIASIAGKMFTWLSFVLPPVIAANIAHWSASVLSGKKISMRARLAMFTGSFVIAAVAHKMFEGTKWEWAIIWGCAMSTEHLLKFIYLESGEIIKQWARTALQSGLNSLTKTKKK